MFVLFVVHPYPDFNFNGGLINRRWSWSYGMNELLHPTVLYASNYLSLS